MVSPAVLTMMKMLENLPEETQNRAVEHLQEWLAELEDETAWNELFKRTQHNLMEAARQARKQLSEGKAMPMDFSRL